ncbi:uncharacterized protein LOC132940846 [Metopolophium dirhodum]|uniref:uncharacterized protein LOC132940846 n=1 Tax=Metopolophium dirhodum TaxID=44670 RepID=UPI00298F677F|nr:uncharacterized protein LOC132940846 [Metopolophium dirhodum]
MDSEEFDTDLFIDKIEKRPPMWDMTSSEYSNEISKRMPWEEIVLIFSDQSDTEVRKKGATLQKKWKNLRDNYVRESKKCKTVKSGSGASKKSTYIHFERLRFLQKSIEKNITESSFCANDENSKRSADTNDENEAFKSPNNIQYRSTKKLKLSPADEHFANLLERSIAQKQVPEKHEDDEDKLFCLSLLKNIKKVPETKRLKLKIDIYNLILQNQIISPPSRYHSPMFNHQYMLSNIVYPNYDTTTSYDTPARRHHQDYTTIEKNNYQHQLTSLSSPSPTPSNVISKYISS